MRRHEEVFPRQTRIVSTLGLCPGEDWKGFLESMTSAGMDVLRLNLSHSDTDYQKERTILAWAREPIVDGEAPRVATLIDLQGPKARIGTVADPGIELVVGAEVFLRSGAAPEEKGVVIPLPKGTGDAVVCAAQVMLESRCDNTPVQLLLGDGDLVLEVIGIESESGIRARVVSGGLLTSRKGITVRGIDIDLDPFPEKDRSDLLELLHEGVDLVAVSFVRSAHDVERVRRFIEENWKGEGLPPGIVAKIETISALQRFESILESSDAVMIARGDLGLQLGVEEIPLEQKRLARLARDRGKPVIVATQMLESMIEHPSPTRAEATDVFNAILDGGDAIMLSAETSIGVWPIDSVQTMDRIARHAEAYRRGPDGAARRRRGLGEEQFPSGRASMIGRVNEQFALTAVQFAERIPAKAVVSFTRTGGTPRRLARYRPTVPLIAVCNSESVARQLLLSYGVHPIVLRSYEGEEPDLRSLVRTARASLHEHYGLESGDAIVVTGGIDWPSGGTNALRVMVEDLEDR